jgi:hypothetical protein
MVPAPPTASARTAVVLPCPQPISRTRCPAPTPHWLMRTMRCSACASSISGADGCVMEYEAILLAIEAGMAPAFSVMLQLRCNPVLEVSFRYAFEAGFATLYTSTCRRRYLPYLPRQVGGI